MENTPVVYRSKVSLIIAAPMLAAFAFAGYTTINARHIVPVIILTVMFGIIIFPMLINTVYTITGTNLNVKSGFIIIKNIDINTITKIIENNGILSAPASSFDRIEVFYNRYDSIVISPKNKKLFAENLKQINPSIVIEF